MPPDTPRVRLTAIRPRRPHRLGLTPLADLVFILLIFFILETSFVEFRQLDFMQPATETAVEAEGYGEVDAVAIAPVQTLEIQLFASRKLWIAGETLSVKGLAKALQERNLDPQTPVLVSSEAEVPAQLLVDVLDVLRSVQLTQISVRELGFSDD